jgi:recombination protein U
MENFTAQKGIAFMLVNFALMDRCFFLPFALLKTFWDEAQKGGKKSIAYESFEQKYLVEQKGGYLKYLDAINIYIESLE